MYIVVIGGGRVGYYLAKALLEEGHEVLLLDKSSAVCKTINEELGGICTLGDGCEAATLADAGTARADMFVAVTGDDDDNLIACQVAKHQFNVPRTIARLRNPQNENLFKMLGVDVTVSSTTMILEAIEREVPTHPLTHLLTLRDKGLVLVDVKIPVKSKVVAKPISTLKIPKDAVIILIVHKDMAPEVPAPDTVLRAEDQIIAITPPEMEETLRSALSS